MALSSRIFAAYTGAARRSADLQLAWLDAADDAYEAYLRWRDGERADAPFAFAAYHAALDREEAAANALRRAVTASA